MSSITPWLWFKDEAEEAADFYVGLFPRSRIETITRYPLAGPGRALESVATVEFTLAGQRLAALNGGEAMTKTHAMSLSYECADQAEIDRVWAGLLEGGREVACGWITDRYGYSWQIVTRELLTWMGDPDRRRAARVMEAMLGMVKLDIAGLKAAHDG